MSDGLRKKIRRSAMRRYARSGSAAVAILAMSIGGCAEKPGGGFQSVFESAASHDVQRGQQCLSRHDFDGAHRRFEEAARLDPGCAAAQAGLGQIAMQRDQLDEAASYFRAALKLDAENSAYAVALGDCLRRLAATALDRQALLESAVRAYRHALSIAPDHYATVIGLAQCYRQQGEFDRAIEALRQAQRIDSSNPQVPILLASVYEAMKRYDIAVNEYRLALKLDPNDVGVHNSLAQLNLTMAKNGRQKGALSRERAIAHYRRSLQLDSNQPDVRRALAELQSTGHETVTEAPPQD